jgi:hypothetical protein
MIPLKLYKLTHIKYLLKRLFHVVTLIDLIFN